MGDQSRRAPNASIAERRELILSLVREHGRASVAELSATLGVSEPTVRRELRRLADAGLVVRAYGGAVAVPGQAGVAGDRGDAAQADVSPAKRRIGQVAAGLVRDGETVVVSSGTTALEVARALRARTSLTVITNALDAASVLLDRPGIEVIVLGGVVRPGIHSLLGHLTETAANELHADVLVMGIAAFDPEHGLTSDHLPEILSDRALRRIANRVVLVAESHKYRRVAPARVFPLSDVDTLVTDSALPEEGRRAIERLGVAVHLADQDSGELPAAG